MADKKIDPNKLLHSLTDEQRTAILNIIRKMQSGSKVNRKDVGLLGCNWDKIPIDFIIEPFEINKRTIYKWLREGCPRNADGTFDIIQVIRWKIGREVDLVKPENDLKSTKLEKEIQILDERIKEIQKRSIDVDLHEDIMSNRASSLRSFLTDLLQKNAHTFANRSVDEIRIMFDQLVQQGMQAYIEAPNV